MKLISFEQDGQAGYGSTDGVMIAPVTDGFRARFPDLKSALAADATGALELADNRVPIAAVRVLPPVPNPAKIVCVGMNYRKPYPVDGVAPPDPDNIILFGKERQTLVGHGGALRIPPGEAADSFDYEAEIAVVIGRPGRGIAAADALDHVAGYTVFNDGSVRDWQRHSIYAGKNFEASGSCGPWLTTADEIADPNAMKLVAQVNGVVVQQALASEMIFGLAEQIAYISDLMELLPGDIIATGSPDGTGGSRTPKGYLRAGDRLEISVSGVGTLCNTVAG